MKLQSAFKRRSLRINVSFSGCSILQFLFKTLVNLLEFTFKIQLKHSGDDLYHYYFKFLWSLCLKRSKNYNGNPVKNYFKISKLYYPLRPGKTANPHFCQYLLTQIMTNFLFVGKITKKEMVAIIYICFLRLLL